MKPIDPEQAARAAAAEYERQVHETTGAGPANLVRHRGFARRPGRPASRP